MLVVSIPIAVSFLAVCLFSLLGLKIVNGLFPDRGSERRE